MKVGNFIQITDRIDNSENNIFYEKVLNNKNEFDKNKKIIFDNSIDSKIEDEFSNFIFDLTEDFYNNTILKNLKPKEGEISIFSSIILQNKNEFKLIVFTSGTRSIPNKFNKEDAEFKIRDCHAEILSLRCLKIFLLKCLSFNFLFEKIFEIMDDPNFYINREFFIKNNFNIYLSFEEFEAFYQNKNFFNVFQIFPNSKIFLKKEVNFHLYISETPCGDCSIYPISNEDLTKCKNIDINNFKILKKFNQTGAKTIEDTIYSFEKENVDKANFNYNNNFSNDKNSLNEKDKDENKIENKFFIDHNYQIGKFRTKSMRSDIKKENISFSLSCSDKILLKNIFGIQGKLLFKIMHPIYISSIVISANMQMGENLKLEIIDSIKRGINILRRDNQIKKNIKFNKFGLVFNEPMVFLIEKNIFNYKKFNNINNIVKTSNENLKKLNLAENPLLNEKLMQSYSMYWFFSKSDFHKIDPNSGLKQGTIVKKEKFNLEKSKLDLCSFDTFIVFLKFLNLYSNFHFDINKNQIINLENISNYLEIYNKKIMKVINILNGILLEIDKGTTEEKFFIEKSLFMKYTNYLKKTSNYDRIKNHIFDLYRINDFINLKKLI